MTRAEASTSFVGRVRDQVQGTAHGVAAVERPLRTAKHLHTLEVQEIGKHHDGPRDVDAVDVQGRARIGPGEHHIAADPTDSELRIVRCSGRT